MRLLLQRSPDPVPYRGAYFRIHEGEGAPARGGIVLPPASAHEDDDNALALLLGLAIALGDPPAGGSPIRQYWLDSEGRLTGRTGSELASGHVAAAERVAERLRTEWTRFLTNALARLRGEPRGDEHFRYPAGEWDRDRAAVLVTRWPPLSGERLPPLE